MTLKNAKSCISIGPKLYIETVYAEGQTDPQVGKNKGILIISTDPKTGVPKGKTGPNFNICYDKKSNFRWGPDSVRKEKSLGDSYAER